MACLDTSRADRHGGRAGRRKAAAAAELVRSIAADGQDLVTTRFNDAELCVVVELCDEPKDDERRVAHILEPLAILDFDDRAARMFASILAHLRQLGRPVGDMDVLIASVCLANGHGLTTRNAKHFRNIPGLILYEY